MRATPVFFTTSDILSFYSGSPRSGRVGDMRGKPTSTQTIAAKAPPRPLLCGVNSADDDDAVIDTLAGLFLDYLLSQHASKMRPADVHIDKVEE